MNVSKLEISPNVYYTPDEAALMLRVPKRAFRKLLESGAAQGVKIGRYWRVLGRDLLQMSSPEELSDAELTQWMMRLAEPTLTKIWDNDEDAIYDEL